MEVFVVCGYHVRIVFALFQVLVSNSLAALSGSSAERIYCDNLNISVCPLSEASKKVTNTHETVAQQTICYFTPKTKPFKPRKMFNSALQFQ